MFFKVAISYLMWNSLSGYLMATGPFFPLVGVALKTFPYVPPPRKQSHFLQKQTRRRPLSISTNLQPLLLLASTALEAIIQQHCTELLV